MDEIQIGDRVRYSKAFMDSIKAPQSLREMEGYVTDLYDRGPYPPVCEVTWLEKGELPSVARKSRSSSLMKNLARVEWPK